MDSSELTFGALPPEAWPIYKAIRLEALLTEPQAFTSKYQDSLAIPDEAWSDRLAKSILLFALQDGKAVGMMGAFDESDEVTCIISAYVQPAFRSLGVGRRLIEAVLDVVGDTGKQIVLDVYPEQLAAIHLYRKVGFQLVKEGSGQGPQRWRLGTDSRTLDGD